MAPGVVQNTETVINDTLIIENARQETSSQKLLGPKVLKNVESHEYLYDRLYDEPCPRVPTLCNERACLGSIMAIPGRGDVPRESEEVLKDAKDFLGQYFASIRRAKTPHMKPLGCSKEYWTGTYQFTPTS
ncbi:unnamed protein product [Arctia plantaginis]|uniref:Uncharacterized protein n=1 Tax=Arctia plantaginis TaxID=874455 RepID=A0A8S1B190_ARCPL|nr:unnamed protein product [Arctia plantaginis]